MAQKKTIIVVGGAHSGQAAAAKARQCNEEARIVLVEQGPLLGVGLKRPELTDDSAMSVLFEEDDHFGKHHDVEIKRNTKAIVLDVDSRCVALESGGKRERLSFDKLIYAGGARSKMLDIAGLYGPHVVNFRSFNDLSAIKKALVDGARRAVVVGCGYYGIEAALKLKTANLMVTVIESKRHIMQRFSLQFSQWMVQKLSELNISILLGESIESADELPGHRFNLNLRSGQKLECDLVIVAIGIEPNVSLLAESGAALDPEGLIRVDNKMATTLPNVYACGSAVSVPISVTNESKWIPAPAIIARTAQIAGHNAAVDDASESLKQFCGTLIIDIGDTAFARTGLNEQEARLYVGDENLLITTVFGSAEESLVYHPEMCVKLLVDRKKRHIIGAEVFGQSGVERRIDLLAVAVGELWPPERLIDLDMAYLKHSGPMLDPLKDAALRAKLALLENTKIISAETLALWLKSNRDFWLVDVGDAPNVSGQSAGKKTLHVPLEALRERLNELEHDDTPIVLYSKSGHKSYLAQRALMQRGFYNVYHLDGGVHAFFMVAKE